MKRISLSLVMLIIAFSVGLVFINCDQDGGTITYTITFETNGGSSVPPISGIASGATVTLPLNPTKDAYRFDGWFQDNGTFLNEFTASTVVIADIKVYAKWTYTGVNAHQIYNSDETLYMETGIATYKFARAGRDNPVNSGNAGSITITDGILELNSLLNNTIKEEYLSQTGQVGLYAGFLEITLSSGKKLRLKESSTEIGTYVYFTGPVNSPNFGTVTLTGETLSTGWSCLGFTMSGETPAAVRKLDDFSGYKWYIEQ
jgi:uncharacterized repeat protein (TIGR02543 family)